MKTYGLILADNGCDMYVQGTYDTRWDNDVLNPAFGSLQASDFEVVALGWQPSSTPGDPCVSGGSGCSRWLVPSSARFPGDKGAAYATDLTVANTGTAAASYVVRFLGHDADGRAGDEKTFTLAAGRSVTYADVLGSLFGRTADYGALQVRSASASLAVAAQTFTPGGGGTYGQSVPGAAETELIRPGSARSLLGVREDASFRTNLVLANATEAPLDVDVALVADSGAALGSSRVSLPRSG